MISLSFFFLFTIFYLLIIVFSFCLSFLLVALLYHFQRGLDTLFFSFFSFSSFLNGII